MTALALDVRELNIAEIDEVAGGPAWFVVAAIWVGRGALLAGGVAAAAVVGEFAVGVVNGAARELRD
jgi:hypothetical protein